MSAVIDVAADTQLVASHVAGVRVLAPIIQARHCWVVEVLAGGGWATVARFECPVDAEHRDLDCGDSERRARDLASRILAKAVQ